MPPLISKSGPNPTDSALQHVHAKPRSEPDSGGLSTCNKVRALRRERNARRYSVNPDGSVVWRSSVEAIVTLRNAQGMVLTVNTRQARQHRAYRRVHTWAESIKRWGAFERPNAVADRNPATWLRPRGQQARLLMLTLTYKSATAWKPNHIRSFMLTLRKRYKGKILAYAWALEMQQRGAPHYHVLLLLKPGTWLALPDASGMWAHGSTDTTQARTPFYIVRYIGKEKQKEGLPRGARMFAVWLSDDVCWRNTRQRLAFRLSSVPRWLGDVVLALAERLHRWNIRYRRAAGGGWLLADTGEIVESGFRVESIELLT